MSNELKHALQDTIGYDDGSMATRLSVIKSNSKFNLKRCNNSSSCANAKSSTMMNGTYTVGSKIKPKSNSVKSNRYKFFLRNRQSSGHKKSEEKVKQQEQHQQQMQITEPEAEMLPLVKSINNEDEQSTHSDSLCDPLFSSTLKSTTSAICDESISCINIEHKPPIDQANKNIIVENGKTTGIFSKTAFKKCLIKNKQESVNQCVNGKRKSIIEENCLFENSMEKMRRSISLPGINDQVSTFSFFFTCL